MTGIRLKAYSAAAAVFALDRLAKWIVENAPLAGRHL